MSASGAADRTARWLRTEPEERAIRALHTVLASLAVLVLLAVPAWAGAAFNGETELQADSDVRLEMGITEEDELGDTTGFVVTVPGGFDALACDGGLEWECTVDGRAITYSRRTTGVGEFISSSLAFDVHTPTVNGAYDFTAVQSDAEGAQMTFHPGATVVGGEEPAPEPSASPSPSPAPTPTSDDSGATASPSPAPSPSPASRTGSSASDDTDGTADRDEDDGGSSGGSTAPRRTQGRSAGTTLEITPGEPAPREQPDVADEPAVAPPDGAAGSDGTAGEDPTTVVAGDGGPGPGEGPAGDVPWQQWAGGALLLLGAAVLVVRRWGGQLAGAPATVANRVRGVGSAAIGRLPGPWGR